MYRARLHTSPVLAVLGLILASVPASASLTFFEVARFENFTQSSNAQPTTPNGFRFSARVFSSNVGEVLNGTVTTPLATVHNMTPATPTTTAFSHAGFASEAALDAVYSMGTYTFALTDAPHAGATDTLNYGTPGWASAVPYLTGTTYSNLQGANVTAAINFTWDPFTAGGTHTGLQSYFYLIDTTNGAVVNSAQGVPASFTSRTIAANTLVAGRTYRYQLLFGVLDQHATTGGFSPASATAATYRSTIGTFTTSLVPEPASFAVLGLGIAALRRKRKA